MQSESPSIWRSTTIHDNPLQPSDVDHQQSLKSLCALVMPDQDGRNEQRPNGADLSGNVAENSIGSNTDANPVSMEIEPRQLAGCLNGFHVEVL